MSDDKLKILKMIEEGTITAEEGAQLLGAVEGVAAGEPALKGSGGNPKWLRVKVLSTENGVKTKANVNVPIALVEIGFKIGKHFNKEIETSMQGLDLGAILEMIKSGAEGKIVEVESDNGDIVEVYVE